MYCYYRIPDTVIYKRQKFVCYISGCWEVKDRGAAYGKGLLVASVHGIRIEDERG